MALKFYTGVAKGSKLKVIKLLGLIPKLVEATGRKLVGDLFDPPILNRVKDASSKSYLGSFKKIYKVEIIIQQYV